MIIFWILVTSKIPYIFIYIHDYIVWFVRVRIKKWLIYLRVGNRIFIFVFVFFVESFIIKFQLKNTNKSTRCLMCMRMLCKRADGKIKERDCKITCYKITKWPSHDVLGDKFFYIFRVYKIKQGHMVVS